MTQGIDHLMAYATSGPQADGTITSCIIGDGTMLYQATKSGQIVGWDLPSNVGFPIKAGYPVLLFMHVLNTGPDKIPSRAKVNFLLAKSAQYDASTIAAINSQIYLPPDTTQTVEGICTAPDGANFFMWTTYSHALTVQDDVYYVNGGRFTNILKTTDWQNPGVRIWSAPDFLKTSVGDFFSYSCAYKNLTSNTITFGGSVRSSEQCLVFGYYFPAAANSPCN
jgi:hypothetical protein